MTKIDAILDRIANGEMTGDQAENVSVEFKTDGRSIPDDLNNLADAAVCFANAAGGTIVVGVSDKTSGPDAFIGTQLDAELTRQRIHEITAPPLVVRVEKRSTPHGEVLILDVPSSTHVHSSRQKIPTERVNRSCQPMTPTRIGAVEAEKTGQDWSAGRSDLAAEAVDPLAMQVARLMLRRSADDMKRRLADSSDIDLLRSLGVVLKDQTLTNAGALLFTSAYDDTTLLSYTHRRTPAGQLTANEQIRGALVASIQRVFDLIEARLETTPVAIGKGQQLHVADLPEGAVREAVVNGLMHREYFSKERTTVEHTVTQMRVTSPGGFVPGVSVENVLTTSSRTRNANLANAMRMLGLAETAGSGVDRMYAEMTRVGHEPPRYSADVTKVEVTLLGGAPNTALARYVSTLPTDEAADADTMLILLTLLSRKTVDAEELVPLLQKASLDEAQSVLARLSGEEVRLLEPTRESARRARPKYRLREDALASLGAAVKYRRRTTDQLDRKIVELVSETGMINSRIVQTLLDLDGGGASRVLADLVERGILVKTSEAKRGPSVTYGRGPSFPVKRSTKRTSSQQAGASQVGPGLFDDLDF